MDCGSSRLDVRVFDWQVVNGLKQRILRLEQQCKEKDNTIKYGHAWAGRGWAGGERAPQGLLGRAPARLAAASPRARSPPLVPGSGVCSVCWDCIPSPRPPPSVPRPLSQHPLGAKTTKGGVSCLFRHHPDGVSLSSFPVPLAPEPCSLSSVWCGPRAISLWVRGRWHPSGLPWSRVVPVVPCGAESCLEAPESPSAFSPCVSPFSVPLLKSSPVKICIIC